MREFPPRGGEDGDTSYGLGGQGAPGQDGDSGGRHGHGPTFRGRPDLLPGDDRRSAPAINAPATVLWLIGLLVAIHVLRGLIPVPDDPRVASLDTQIIYSFSFIPARISAPVASIQDVPLILGPEGRWLTFLSHAALHADWVHLSINMVWLLAFGAPVAWRMGQMRFLLFFAACAVAGALAQLVVNPASILPMIGASGAISGLMGGAARFIFTQQPALHGLAGMIGRPSMVPPPLAPLLDRRVLGFVAVWTGINLVFGAMGQFFVGEGQAIAWEAHLGGFLAGLVLMPLFDPVRPSRYQPGI